MKTPPNSWARDSRAHRGRARELSGRRLSTALAFALRRQPGHHPGHPTAERGLPTSKPGLGADTHDLGAILKRATDTRPPHLRIWTNEVYFVTLLAHFSAT